MKSYKLLYLFWLLPIYLGGLLIHQASVYYGITDTYENGNSYTAEVVEFEFKQIAAQTNGYVVIRFQTEQGIEIERKLSLPVEMAGKLQDSRIIPVRYLPQTIQEIVLVPTFNAQKGLVLTNMGMSSIGFLITLVIAIYAHRQARKKMSVDEKESEFIIERVD